MAKGTLIKAYISEFIVLINDLKNFDAKIADEDQGRSLLYLLPPYKTFRETTVQGRDDLPFDNMKSNLLRKRKLDNKLGSRN